METIQIKDKRFRISIPEDEIKARVKAVAGQINHDMAGQNPLFLCVLNGSFIFAADLMREITIPSTLSFVKLASYEGTTSTGTVHEVIGLSEPIAGRTVVIVEDIIDTGRTMRQMIDTLRALSPAAVHICTLFVKPTKLEAPLDIDYTAFSIPDDFIVGYGLDYDQQGRNLRHVYTIVE